MESVLRAMKEKVKSEKHVQVNGADLVDWFLAIDAHW
jgi:hypothetical protein